MPSLTTRRWVGARPPPPPPPPPRALKLRIAAAGLLTSGGGGPRPGAAHPDEELVEREAPAATAHAARDHEVAHRVGGLRDQRRVDRAPGLLTHREELVPPGGGLEHEVARVRQRAVAAVEVRVVDRAR